MDRLNCQNCALATLCVPHCVPQDDLQRIETFIQRGKPLHAGDHLFEAGDTFRSLYVISSGCLKTSVTTENGQESITAFVLPGEMAGLGGISDHVHQETATALDTTMVCELPFDQMETLCAQLPGLQHFFFESLSRQVIGSQQVAFQLSTRSAEERLAAFLWGLSVRQSRRRLSALHFRLPMTRTDIARYLGLSPETVSRLINNLQKQGVAQFGGREVELLDIGVLARLAGAPQMDKDSRP